MNKAVRRRVECYPGEAKECFELIRELIFKTVAEQKLTGFEETLKWGEPAYLTEQGSTVRVDWKPTSPDHIWLFFNCRTVLVETIREVYGDVFIYQKNRALGLPLNEPVPIHELQHSLCMALNYHTLKHRPLLGA